MVVNDHLEEGAAAALTLLPVGPDFRPSPVTLEKSRC